MGRAHGHLREVVTRVIPIALVAVAIAGCAGVGDDEEVTGPARPDAGTEMTVTSAAFAEGEPIPVEFTCDGADRSPPLAFQNAPQNASAIALVMSDPDAPGGTFVHWAFWDLPVEVRTVASGADVAALGGTEGANDAGETRYVGPCPPSGTHTYVFRAHAQTESLGLDRGAAPEDVAAALEGRVAATAEIIGTYSRG